MAGLGQFIQSLPEHILQKSEDQQKKRTRVKFLRIVIYTFSRKTSVTWDQHSFNMGSTWVQHGSNMGLTVVVIVIVRVVVVIILV